MPSKTIKSNTGKVGDASTLKTAREALAGKSKKGALARLLPFISPALIASVVYMDPGNFATNNQGGV